MPRDLDEIKARVMQMLNLKSQEEMDERVRNVWAAYHAVFRLLLQDHKLSPAEIGSVLQMCLGNYIGICARTDAMLEDGISMAQQTLGQVARQKFYGAKEGTDDAPAS